MPGKGGYWAGPVLEVEGRGAMWVAGTAIVVEGRAEVMGNNMGTTSQSERQKETKTRHAQVDVLPR